MLKILAVGNSFSADATEYLSDMAAADKAEVKVGNLYIGGCSLATHWEKIEKREAAYEYYVNAKLVADACGIEEALRSDAWDIVTVQQCSNDSGFPDTYTPYLEDIVSYVKGLAPAAKICIHETWAYETDSDHPNFADYEKDQCLMYEKLKAAYQYAASVIGAEIIPCGTVIQSLRRDALFDYANGGPSLCRDGFHLHLFYGRFAAAATRYRKLLQGNLFENRYLPPLAYLESKELVKERIAFIKTTVMEVCGGL